MLKPQESHLLLCSWLQPPHLEVCRNTNYTVSQNSGSILEYIRVLLGKPRAVKDFDVIFQLFANKVFFV